MGRSPRVRWSNTTSVDGMRKAAAIVVAIAVIDPKSQVLLVGSTSRSVVGQLADFPTNAIDTASTMKPGELLHNWQTGLDGVTDMPRPAIAGVRLYERCFYLPATSP